MNFMLTNYVFRKSSYCFLCALVFILQSVLLFSSLSAAEAAQPPNPITEPHTVSGEEVWTNDIVFDGEGTVKVTGKLTISGAKVTTTKEHRAHALSRTFDVDEGGVLTFEKGSVFDLSNLRTGDDSYNFFPFAIFAQNNAVVNIDGSEISDAYINDGAFAPIIIKNSELNFVNGSAFRDNVREGTNSLIYIENGKFRIEDSEVTGNRLQWPDDDYDMGMNGIFAIRDSEVIIERSVLSGNVFGKPDSSTHKEWGSFAVFNFSGGTLTIGGSKILDNRNAFPTIDTYGTILNVMDDNEFVGNDYIFMIRKTEMTVGDRNRFFQNTGPYIEARESDVIIGNHNLFSGESTYTSAGNHIWMEGGTLAIGDDNEFSRGDARYGGSVCIYKADVTIGRSLFKENTSGYVGGAICHNGGSLTLNGTEFVNNDSGVTWETTNLGLGGAVFFDSKGPTLMEDIHPAALVINDAVFTGNSASRQGGALYLGASDGGTLEDQPYDWENPDNTYVDAVIHSASFSGNSVERCWRSTCGGAIYLNNNARLSMKNAVINDNLAENAGGGIANGMNGRLILKPRSGALVFGNLAGEKTQGLTDIYVTDNNSIYTIDERMFNGGKHHWQTAGPIRARLVKYADIPDQQRENVDVEGTYFGADPSSEEISGASVLVQKNTAKGYELYFDMMHATDPVIAREYTGNGGGIGNDGLLILGEDMGSFDITKQWKSVSAENRPDPAAFLNSLTILSGDSSYESGEWILNEKMITEEGDIFHYFAAKDPNVTITLRDAHAGEFQALAAGFPADPDGSFAVRETMPGYETDISGNAEDGFVIVNTRIPEPTPEPDPQPTAPSPLFFLLNSETLPKTGF